MFLAVSGWFPGVRISKVQWNFALMEGQVGTGLLCSYGSGALAMTSVQRDCGGHGSEQSSSGLRTTESARVSRSSGSSAAEAAESSLTDVCSEVGFEAQLALARQRSMYHIDDVELNFTKGASSSVGLSATRESMATGTSSGSGVQATSTGEA